MSDLSGRSFFLHTLGRFSEDACVHQAGIPTLARCSENVSPLYCFDIAKIKTKSKCV